MQSSSITGDFGLSMMSLGIFIVAAAFALGSLIRSGLNRVAEAIEDLEGSIK